MKRIAILFILCAAAFAQAPVTEGLVSVGASFDFLNREASANTGVGVRIASLGGLPTYSFSTFETALAKTPGQSSQALTLKTGFLQILWKSSTNHVGLFVFTQAGLLKTDIVTLGNFDGAVGAYFDIVGWATKDKFHAWLSPVVREVNITSLQLKPVYGFQLTTAFTK